VQLFWAPRNEDSGTREAYEEELLLYGPVPRRVPEERRVQVHLPSVAAPRTRRADRQLPASRPAGNQWGRTLAAVEPRHGSAVSAINGGTVAWTARPQTSQRTGSPGFASGRGRQEPGQSVEVEPTQAKCSKARKDQMPLPEVLDLPRREHLPLHCLRHDIDK
jgi:hypothetical protein